MNKIIIPIVVIVILVVGIGAYFAFFAGKGTHTTTTASTTTVVTSSINQTTASTTTLSTTSTGTPTTTVVSYNYVYNGNFSDGTYAGWNLTGKGWGPAPANITYANAHDCYIGSPFTNLNGQYFATTLGTQACGISVAPGNLTSSYFTVSQPYLNFQVISPASEILYVEILHDGKPQIIYHYNTYNISYGSTGSYTFRNASIPLSLLPSGEPVQVRVVATSFQSEQFIAVGGFTLSQTPHQDPGIIVNSSFQVS